MATTTVLDVRRARTIFHQQLEQRGLLMASTLNDVLGNLLYFTDIDGIQDIATVVSGQPDVTFVRVFRPDGRLLADTQQPGRYASGINAQPAARTIY